MARGSCTDPPARVGSVDRVCGDEARTGAIVARCTVPQDVTGAFDCAHLAQHGRAGVGSRDRKPQAAGVGVHEPGASGRLRQRRGGPGSLVSPGDAYPSFTVRALSLARSVPGAGGEDLPAKHGRGRPRSAWCPNESG